MSQSQYEKREEILTDLRSTTRQSLKEANASEQALRSDLLKVQTALSQAQSDYSLSEDARARERLAREKSDEEHARRIAAAVEAADKVHGAITESVVQSGGAATVGVGLVLREAGGLIKVSKIQAGSPAASSRIGVGDTVVEIAGHKIKADSKLTAAQVEKLVMGEPGQHIEVRMRSSSGTATGTPKGKEAAGAEYTATLVCKKTQVGKEMQTDAALDLVLGRVAESCEMAKAMHSQLHALKHSLDLAKAQHAEAEANWLAQFDELRSKLQEETSSLRAGTFRQHHLRGHGEGSALATLICAGAGVCRMCASVPACESLAG